MLNKRKCSECGKIKLPSAVESIARSNAILAIGHKYAKLRQEQATKEKE
jgi:hypothetical protein